jgi:peptidyl-prolyl cis-trans isomerase C
MMRRSKTFLLLPALALTLAAAGLAGCNRDEQSAETQTTDQAQSDTPAPGTPSTPGTTPAAPGTPPAPGTAPAPAPEQDLRASQPMDPAQLPAVVARINGKEIKKEELVNRAQEMRVQLARMRGVQVPLSSGYFHEILDGMIAHQLLLDEAKALGISISEAEADQMMMGFKSQFPSQEAFNQQLAANKMTEAQLKDKMRNDSDTKVNKLIRTRIAANVKISEADARAFYDQNKERMKTAPQVHLRHILIGVTPQASAADRQKAKQKADDLLKQIKDGGDFAQLASQNSDDPGSKTRGGDLSWVEPGQTVPAFEKAAFALKQPNDLSPVVETRFGYHIIQLVERKASQPVPFEQAKSRIGMMLQDQKIKEALHAHIQELKTKGKVETFI